MFLGNLLCDMGPIYISGRAPDRDISLNVGKIPQTDTEVDSATACVVSAITESYTNIVYFYFWEKKQNLGC